ncbi:hypothetical protein SAMN05428949_5259 [Chitinophaga sp. YR627]|uniref:nuclear transport factor 2 family protein n=1 Tax=Chitinophaga sp. YR627 TaxID=1881041 RepID=UPI0008E389F4|nr:nuclear transport factor 2 family protein [Chitinophaga sp. YR627]SFO46481.1 hypothetical protein SAMN05428949_5259 [Chitinophaga sp. YR627]
MANTTKQLEDSLLVIWNDRDAQRRLEVMKEIYAPDVVFYETNEGPAIKGYQAINDLITALQGNWPPAFRFALREPLKVNHQVQYISWTLGIPGEVPVASGMDIAIIENELIQSLHLFLDTPQG